MKKVIAFSLWGSNPKYTVGAVANAKLASVIYPDWLCEFYVGSDVPENILAQLKNQKNSIIIPKTEPNNWTGMFWRFHAGYNADITIFRDTDSRLSAREKCAVDEWLVTDKTFHIMRDHPYHKSPILGGMWGFKNTDKYPLQTLLNNFNAQDKYGTDYDFLGKVLYPLIQDDKIVHDPFFENKPFPTERSNREFVGDVYDEFNNRHPDYYKLIP